jgi:hypothetical protein
LHSAHTSLLSNLALLETQADTTTKRLERTEEEKGMQDQGVPVD